MNYEVSADVLAEILEADNKHELFVAGIVSKDDQAITLIRADDVVITVPFSEFEVSGDGIVPDFDKFEIIDHGLTIKLGDYEAASNAIQVD